MYAVLALSVFVNTVGIRMMPYLESLILVLHVLGFFAILIPLVHLAPMSSSHFVFSEFVNESGYPDGLSWFVGLTASSVLFIGKSYSVFAQHITNKPLQATTAQRIWVSI